MGGEGSGRKPVHHDARHKQVREAVQRYRERKKHLDGFSQLPFFNPLPKKTSWKDWLMVWKQ